MTPPTFSLVIPTYGVAAYLPAFLASLAAQHYPLRSVDLVFVDDGSPDDSASFIDAWAQLHAPHATLVSQANAGLSAARNRGLAQARGTWVTFCDPDDVLSPGYLQEVARFLDEAEAGADADQVDLVACYITMLDDATGTLVDRHALRRRFTAKPQLVDLVREPERLHLQSASAFYRRERIEQLGLRFDPRIRPNFEDAAFTARYLWSVPRPRVAFLPDAQYCYRRRADGTSLVQQSWANPAKYVDVPRHGYLGLMRDLVEQRGRVPTWVQNLVLYDLFGYYREDDRSRSLVSTIEKETLEEFWAIQTQALRLLDPWAIEAFRVVAASQQIRLAAATGAGLPLPDQVWAARLDESNQTIELRYVYAGSAPDERLISRGQPVQPIWGKHRTVDYFGRDLYSERIAWVSATGTIAVELDGRRRPLIAGPPAPRDFRLGPTALWRALNDSSPPSNASTKAARSAAAAVGSAAGPPATPGASPSARAGTSRARISTSLQRLGRGLNRRLGRDGASTLPGPAWLLVDGSGAGGANVRALAAYLRRQRPDLEFAMVSETAGGSVTDNPVAPGSERHAELLERASVLISAPLDPAEAVPDELSWSGLYVSLTDGVWITDRSRLLDTVSARLITTASVTQQRIVVGDGTRSTLTDREVQLTGLPMHDLLLASAKKHRPCRLLIAPADRDGGSGRTPDPSFLAPWSTLLTDPVLELVRHAGLRPTFRSPAGCALELPLPGVDVAPADADPITLLAETAVLVTDHGAGAFDVAALGRPVIYLRPDGDDYLSGRYGHRPTRVAPEEFGPLATDPTEAAHELAAVLAGGCSVETRYADRMAADLPTSDGHACSRVVAAVERLTRPLRHAEAYLPVR